MAECRFRMGEGSGPLMQVNIVTLVRKIGWA